MDICCAVLRVMKTNSSCNRLFPKDARDGTVKYWLMAFAYQGAIRWEHYKISQLVIFNDDHHSFKRFRKTVVSSRKTDKTAERRKWWRDTVMATRGI